jgi:HK97 gp10 family phage protein
MVTVRFEGGAELAAALRKLSTRISRRIAHECLVEAAEPMRRRMSSLAPHEPGKPDLRDTIVISRARGEDAQESAVAVGPSKFGFYGSFLEFGTKQMAAQPFARPAFDQTHEQSLQILGAACWRELAARGVSRSISREGPVEELGLEWESEGTTIPRGGR